MRRKELQCPFCNNLLARPVDINFKAMELTGGICRCSAVYVFDRTGHNLGEIYLDALTFLCRGDLDKSVFKPEDYETVDFDYDQHTNTVSVETGEDETLFVRFKNWGIKQNKPCSLKCGS
jgi:hypothetical protein